MLVIADAERAQAIGGVMGGATSEIGAGTTLMVLESAYFKPASVRRTSKRLGLKTEASTRFERGADVNAAPVAIARAAALLQQIGAAQPLGPMIDRYPVATARDQADAASVADRARAGNGGPGRRGAQDSRAARLHRDLRG